MKSKPLAPIFLLLLGLEFVYCQNMCPDVTGCYCYNSNDDVRADCLETPWEFIPEDFPLNTTEIIITRSPLFVLEKGNLSLYSELTLLDLRENDLQTIVIGAFDGVDFLEDLYLYNNLLTEISPGTFSNLKQLNMVFLQNNKLTTIPPFNEVTTLVFVNLQINEITSIKASAFGSNAGLRSINLSYNKITTIEINAFNNLNNLENLFIDANKIQALGPGTLNGLSGLISLSLMNNTLESLTDGSFQGTGDHLTDLHLGNNNLSTIQENVFTDLVKLKSLQLGHNLLTAVPSAAIKKIKTLNYLDISANLFHGIEDYAFSDLPGLNTLNIGYMNTLVEISENAFSGTTNLTQLSLFSNKFLTDLTPAHFPDDQHIALLSLRLYDNGFTSLNEEIFSGKENLARVDLYWNPFHCDCRLKWMTRVVQENVTWAKHWDNEIPILCESPDHLQTFEIPRMRDKDFTCSEPEVELSTPKKVVAYLHGNATLQTYGHNGIPETWWVAPSGEHYHPLRSPPPESIISERVTVTELFEKTNTENVVVATLEFSNTTQDDAGIYIMWASNHVANVSIEVELEVLPYELTSTIAYYSTSPVVGAATTLHRLYLHHFFIVMISVVTLFINHN